MGASDVRAPPFFFAKPADAVMPSGSAVPYPARTADLHHEIELVVALGAGREIYGYAVGDDLTRRDVQAAAKKDGKPWDTAKGFDHSAPVSPIARAADIGHPARGRIWLEVNGKLRQEGDIGDMIWSVPRSSRSSRPGSSSRRATSSSRHAGGRRSPEAGRPRARRRGRRRPAWSIRSRRDEALLLLAKLCRLACAHRALVEGHPARNGARTPRARRGQQYSESFHEVNPRSACPRSRTRAAHLPVARDHRVPRGDTPGAAAPAGRFRGSRNGPADGAPGRLRDPPAAEHPRAQLPARAARPGRRAGRRVGQALDRPRASRRSRSSRAGMAMRRNISIRTA
jgi:hypothetical protein